MAWTSQDEAAPLRGSEVGLISDESPSPPPVRPESSKMQDDVNDHEDDAVSLGSESPVGHDSLDDTRRLLKADGEERRAGEDDGDSGGGCDAGCGNWFSVCRLSWRKIGLFSLLGWSNFAAFMCFAILDPFYPIEAVKKGMSVTVMGLVFSCFELAVFVSSPFFGNYIDSIGPKFTFIAGQFLCAGCTILFGLTYMSPAGTSFITLCFVLRSMQALGASAFLTASFTITAAEFSDQVAVIYGMLETFVGVGEVAGALFGGLLYQLGGFGLPFYTLGALLLATCVVAFFVLPSSQDAAPQKPEGSSLRLLKSPLIVFSCLAIVATCYTAGFFDSATALHVQQFHLPEGVVGTFWGVYSILYALSCPVFGRFTDRGNFSYIFMIGGGTIMGVGLLLIGPTPLLPFLKTELWLIVVSVVTLGIGTGAILIASLTCFYTGARQLGFEEGIHLDGLVACLVNTSFYLGTLLGPAIGNAIMERYGYPWSATLNSALCFFPALCLSTYLLVDKKCHKQRPENQRAIPYHCGTETTHLLVDSHP